MKTSLEDDIKNLARQIYKLEKGTSSQEFYDLALELFEKVIIIKNQNSLVEKNSLTKYLEDNNLSFINDKIENPDDNEKETFTPLIETIKDMIPEMPETNIGSSIIDGVTDNILFESWKENPDYFVYDGGEGEVKMDKLGECEGKKCFVDSDGNRIGNGRMQTKNSSHMWIPNQYPNISRIFEPNTLDWMLRRHN